MKTTYQPFVSVLIPTYNCAQFIGEAINSILAQNYDNLEIIVVDDGSTDDTEEVVKRNTFPKTCYVSPIRYFRKEHSGISATRNFCLEKARGELIAWLDADDYWLEGKLQAQVDYLEQNPECQAVFTQFEDFFDNEEVRQNPVAVRESDYSANTDNRHHFTTVLTKKNVFEECGMFDTQLITGEDEDMIYRFRMNGIDWNCCVEKVYYRRRLYGGNITLLCNGEHYKLTRNFVLKNLMNNVKKRFQ